MKNRFVVAIEGLTAAETKQVSNLFRADYGWWHWIDGFWLVTDPSGTLTPVKIREMIETVDAKARHIVLKVSFSRGWAGRGPTSDEKNMFRWIRETWSE